MKFVRFPVSCLVAVAAAAFPWGMPPAVAEAALPIEVDEVAVQPVAVPLDRDLVFQEVVVWPGGVVVQGEGGGMAGDEGRLIYSNTLGIHAVNFPTNQPVSDDIATTAPDGCNLRTFKFKVLGRVFAAGTCLSGSNYLQPCTMVADCPGGTCSAAPGTPYTVKYALYTTCPLSVGSTSVTAHLRELVKIPGTLGEVSFLDDGPRAIKHVVDSHNPVAIPTNVYLGLQFNRGNCGTVVGAPAMVGFSADVWDSQGYPCNVYLGGFPALPHASFWVEMYGDASCPASFPGYKCQKPSGGQALPGANIQAVDDVKLQVSDCQMVGYEVAVKGVGFYTFDLRRQCDSQIIVGTERTFQVTAATTPQLQIARFTFNPPIRLTTDAMYFGFKCSASTSGAIIAGVQPIIGESTSDYFIIEAEGCAPVAQLAVHGAVNLAITCAGDLPMGACCDMALLECQGGADQGKRCTCNSVCVGGSLSGACCSADSYCVGSTQPPGTCVPYCAAPGTCEAVCREAPEMNCPWPPRWLLQNPAWVEGGTCESAPFPLACGLAACCKPDDTCENLTQNECNAVPPLESSRLWQVGEYCGQGSQRCPFSACVAHQGVCSLVHEGVGCSDPFCCTDVCTRDPWCCHVEWDRQCVELAGELCSSPPANDSCGYVRGQAPVELFQSTPFFGTNQRATESPYDPGFCCNGSDPGATGPGTVWFKFVATHESAQIDTCASDPEGDTMINVFAGAPSCQSLSLIGCGDDGGCPTFDYDSPTLHSRFCVDGLTVGETYYIMLASKTWADMGTYEIEIKMPCQYLTPFPSGDCNENGTVDGCELAERTSRDCDRNGLLDECESAPDASLDCDKDGVIDTCDAFRQRLVSDPPSHTFGRTLAFEEDLLMVGDPDYAAEYAGAVHTYERDANDWSYSEILTSPDPSLYTSFGYAIAASGHRLLVVAGDPNEDDHVYGRVFAYRRSQHTWLQEDFPNLTSEAGSIRVITDVIVEGDLAAVKTSCSDGPQYCNMDVVVHMFRRVGSQWQPDGVVPIEGSFKGESFAFDLSNGFLAVSTKGKYLESENSNGSLFVFEQQRDQWVQTTQRSVGVEKVTSISFSGTLIAVGGTYSEWNTGRQLAAISLYRKRDGIWDIGGGALQTGYEASGVLPQVAILTPISLAITVSKPGDCPAATIFQRTSYPCDWCSYWVPLTQLDLTHCGTEPRTLTMDAGPNGVALGIWGSSFYGDPGLPPASVQVFAQPLTDCDGSGAVDSCEIQAGTLEDCNMDKAADVCQARGYYGDYDLDMSLTLRDMAGLQNCFSGTPYIALCCGVFDVSSPEGIDMVDLRAFAGAMTGP